MVNVKLFGLLRLDTGVKEFDTEAEKVKDIFPVLISKAKEINPDKDVTIQHINSCAVMVNGAAANKHTKLKDGDKVVFMSMVAGG